MKTNNYTYDEHYERWRRPEGPHLLLVFSISSPHLFRKKKLKKFDCLIGKSLHLGRVGLGQRNLSRQSPVEFMHFSPSGSGANGSFLRAAADSFFGF